MQKKAKKVAWFNVTAMCLHEVDAHKLANIELDWLVNTNYLHVLQTASTFVHDVDYFSVVSAYSFRACNSKVKFSDAVATPRHDNQRHYQPSVNDQTNNTTRKNKLILTNNKNRNLSQGYVETDRGVIKIKAPRDSLVDDILSTIYSEERMLESAGGHGITSACN